jgi:hypothetical protein
MKTAETIPFRMREDELIARTRYHADRLREAERLTAFHRTALKAARAELDALRSNHEAPGPIDRELTAFISTGTPPALDGRARNGSADAIISRRITAVNERIAT